MLPRRAARRRSQSAQPAVHGRRSGDALWSWNAAKHSSRIRILRSSGWARVAHVSPIRWGQEHETDVGERLGKEGAVRPRETVTVAKTVFRYCSACSCVPKKPRRSWAWAAPQSTNCCAPASCPLCVSGGPRACPHATSTAGSQREWREWRERCFASCLVIRVPPVTIKQQAGGARPCPLCRVPLPSCISWYIWILTNAYEFVNVSRVRRHAPCVACPIHVRWHPESSTSRFLQRQAMDCIVEVSLVHPGRPPDRVCGNGTRGRPP
jgi:hypothetical protein